MPIIKNLLMEKITINEKSELASGVRARIDELKKKIYL